MFAPDCKIITVALIYANILIREVFLKSNLKVAVLLGRYRDK